MNEVKQQYHCSNCNTALQERNVGIKIHQIVESCLECGSLLSQSLQDRSVAIQSRPKVVFQTASSIPKLTFDIEKLDSILHFLRPGQIVGITGTNSQQLIERLCVRAQMPRRYGGLGSSVVLVDGNNSSDPYLCIDFARQYGLKVDDVLSKIVSTRAFTIYQLASLVINILPDIIKKYDAKLVIISDIFGMFINDPYLDPTEAKVIIKELVHFISKIKKTLIVISMPKPSPFDEIIEKIFHKQISLSKRYHRVHLNIDDKQLAIKEYELVMVPQR